MIRKFFVFVCLLMCFCVSVAAEQESSGDSSPDLDGSAATETIEEGFNVQNSEEVREVIEYDFILNQPIATYNVNPDDIVSGISTFAIGGDVFEGSYNSTIVTMWQGLVLNNLGKEYVAWRGSQYDYYICFGEDFNYSSGRLSGSGRLFHTNTYSNSYGYDISNDSFNISVGNQYVFTNITSDFPALANERGVMYEEISIFCLFIILGFNVLRWVFVKR